MEIKPISQKWGFGSRRFWEHRRFKDGGLAADGSPIKKNDIFTVEIEDLCNNGSGVGRVGGKAVFVPFAAVGDRAEVKALKVAKSVIYGKVTRILTPSPDRVEIDCGVFGKCGGCDFRHISYQAELNAKQTFIHDAFTRIGKLWPLFAPIVGSEAVCGYRNKAQLPVGKVDGDVVCGFYASGSHRLIPFTECMQQPKIFKEIADFIILYIREHQILVYDEDTRSGGIRHICVRKGHYSGELNVTVVSGGNLHELKKLANLIKEKFPTVKGVTLNINDKKNNVILGEREVTLAGESDITDTVSGVKAVISPRSFYQVNTPAAGRLYGIICEFAKPDGKTILDLYCGIGTIGLCMAKGHGAKEIIGIERVESAVINAVENARVNNIDNARFICGDANDMPALLEGVTPDVVILDPARKGCDADVIESIAGLSPERIVMASCDPATAARDCSRLKERGYDTVKVAGVDMFPRTRHVECVALLVKQTQ